MSLSTRQQTQRQQAQDRKQDSPQQEQDPPQQERRAQEPLQEQIVMTTSKADYGAVKRLNLCLRTVDQYDMWKLRVHNICYGSTRIKVFEIDDAKCDEIMGENDNVGNDNVSKCWTIITESIHDELMYKLGHIQYGHLHTLIEELRAALMVNMGEDLQPVRVELYSASMSACGCDLQAYISYISKRRDKLKFLKIVIPEDELVHIFLKGLPPIYNALQIHFAVPGNLPKTLEEVVIIARKFTQTPHVHSELVKMKGGSISQSVFNVTEEKQACRKFAIYGNCRYGNSCKFSHSNNAISPSTSISQPVRKIKCNFCQKIGHIESKCRAKQKTVVRSENKPINAGAIALAVNTENQGDHEDQEQEHDDQLMFMMTHKQTNCEIFMGMSPDNANGGWIVDSGATTCATSDEQDCIDVRGCNINVTTAGCKFQVQRIGTAVINTVDTSGVQRTITIKECLISDKFPYKILSMHRFAKNGHTITMKGDAISIKAPDNKFELTARRDSSGLFFLPIVREKLLLSRTKSADDTNMLWRLHLKHGHRNFKDVCTQYGLQLPKTLPACASCVMGKSHTHPHLDGGYDRATRAFKGPFTTETPFGHRYLLTIIDDYSRRVFGFLVKSQTEWFDVFTRHQT